MQTLFERDDPQALLQAAKLGDETITREFLNKFKNEVYILLLAPKLNLTFIYTCKMQTCSVFVLLITCVILFLL